MAWKREPQLLDALDRAVPRLLAEQRPHGQFGTEPWISTDQNVLLALAAAWSLPESTHYQRDEVLAAIVRGGNALIAAQDDKGMFTFRKKDHSTWGQIYMPWVYSRWVRAFAQVCQAMDQRSREQWSAALLRGYEGIAATALNHVHNIPAHHAMGLYCAGTVFDRPAWIVQAREFLHRVAAEQSPYGWWAEHQGPVVAYNFVYVEALGVYYALSNDDTVLDALQRAAAYHAACTYPDGSLVETVDGRNPYHAGIRLGNAGFAHTAAGRGFLARQHRLYLEAGRAFDADYAAHLLLYGADGEMIETAASRDEHTYWMGDQALMRRQRPWFMALSAFTAPVPQNRWGQDRQNVVSLFHDSTGLIVGGGNTKLQPLWSTFTVGDPALLRHVPGDANPDFSPRPGLAHTPNHARLEANPEHVGLELAYGDQPCRITLRPESPTEITISLTTAASDDLPVEAHVTLLPRMGQPVRSAVGMIDALDEGAFDWSDPQWLEHAGWRLEIPGDSRVCWPVLPHNPYRKDGGATASEGRIVVIVPLRASAPAQDLRLRVRG